MPHKTIPHDCAITFADLPAMKVALEVILGEDFKPTHRLEIFARLAGYRTWASLKSDLEPRLDFAGDTVPLYLTSQPPLGDPFFEALPVAQRRKLRELEQIGILRMVDAAIMISYDPVFGEVGVTQDDMIKIEIMARAPRQRDPFWPSTFPAGPAFLLVSPANIAALRHGASEVQGSTSVEAKRAPSTWHLAAVMVEEGAAFYDEPDLHDIRAISVEGIVEVCRRNPDANLLLWSEEDAKALQKELKQHTDRVIDPRHLITIQKDAHQIDTDCGDDFFNLGYRGTARVPLPEDGKEIDGHRAILWLSELGNVVHGVATEAKRTGFTSE